mmetsp:Transcript_10911/g.22362  ORF Transcript_10911/g.22362 Transcript_10911/m.22362 type:complete len:166 (-) Transcript_10911:232-729(-)
MTDPPGLEMTQPSNDNPRHDDEEVPPPKSRTIACSTRDQWHESLFLVNNHDDKKHSDQFTIQGAFWERALFALPVLSSSSHLLFQVPLMGTEIQRGTLDQTVTLTANYPLSIKQALMGTGGDDSAHPKRIFLKKSIEGRKHRAVSWKSLSDVLKDYFLKSDRNEL